MKSLSPKLQMLAVLGATRALAAQSPHEGWPDELPTDCVAILDQMMAHIINPSQNNPPEYAGIQFAPTGPIQEIAISNGWHDAYMNLSTEYDRLEKKLKLFSERNA